jgi:hypothetical protein
MRMSKKPTLYLTLLALLTGGFLYANRDWFQRRPIQITHRFYAFGGRFDRGGVAPIMFEFNRKLKLTSIKVVPVPEGATNTTSKSAPPLWYVISDSGSVPTRGFLYGMEVPGMHAASKGANAAPLGLNEKYRLLIEAGSVKAEHDFDLDPDVH